MRYIILIFLILSVGISLASANTYSGSVLYGATGPVSGVIVSSGNYTDTTDANGFFFISLPDGVYNFSYQKDPEYIISYRNITVVGVMQSGMVLLDAYLKPTGTITGTVTAPCIPATSGLCYSGYEPPYTLFTIPYYQGEPLEVITGAYDDVLMFDYHTYTDFVEVQNNSVYTFQKCMTATPIRIYSNSSIAVVHKRTDQHIVVNPVYVLSHNIQTDILSINQDAMNIVHNLGDDYEIEYFGHGGRFNV